MSRSRGKQLVVAMVSTLALSMLAVPPAGAAPRAASATKCADPSGTVKIGVSYFGGVGQAYSDIGGDSSNTPADQAIVNGYQKGVDALNAAGGLAGCQVDLVTYNFRASAPDFNSESQKECAAFTQDNDVVAVFGLAYETQVAVNCYAKAKVPFFASGGNYPLRCDELKKYAGYLYLSTGVGTCRFSSFIGLFDKAGLFPKDAKVGILVADDGTGGGKYVADRVYGPALKKLKIPFETFTYHASTSTTDFATTNSSLSPAILKFKSDGVNVVLFTPIGAQSVAAFMPQAANQGFFPSYGLDSSNSLPVAAALGATAIKNGIAVSWAITDLPIAAQQTLPTNPAVTECATWSPPNPAALTGSSMYCDFLNLLKASLGDATKTDAATIQKRIDALGTTFISSVTYGGATKFGKNVYGGASQGQMLQFNPSTKAWEFSSPSQKAVTIP